MGSRQIRLIYSALLEYQKSPFETVKERYDPDQPELEEDEDLCLTFQAIGTDQWIQVLSDSLNLYWTPELGPALSYQQELHKHFPKCSLLRCDENCVAFWMIEWPKLPELAVAIHRIFTQLFRVAKDDSLEYELFLVDRTPPGRSGSKKY